VKLTCNWPRLHRSYTVIVSLLLAVVAAAHEHLPLFAGILSARMFAWLSMIAGIAIAILRYVDQPCLRDKRGGSRNGDQNA